MSDKDKLAREMTRYVDGLMSPAEEAAFLSRVEADPELRAELASQQKLKEVTDDMSMTQLPDRIWDGYWQGVYRRIERGTAWILFCPTRTDPSPKQSLISIVSHRLSGIKITSINCSIAFGLESHVGG